MRVLRLLLTRRWLAFAVVVALLAYLAWWLGEWQFGRLHDREHSNAVIEANYDAEPVPVSDVLAPGDPVAADEEWMRVEATGTYVVEESVVVRYQTREGTSGIDVVVPLVGEDGVALLVDRGWLLTDNAGARPDDLPDPPTGEVTVVGWVRPDGSGSSTQVTDDLSTRAVSSSAIGEALDREVYGGFVDLQTEDPEPDERLMIAERPDTSNGPHFFYGLQWWFFGALAVFGFFKLLYDEVRAGHKAATPPSESDSESEPEPESDSESEPDTPASD